MLSRHLFASFLTQARIDPELEALAPVARVVLYALIQKLGRNPRVLDFIEIYGDLKDLMEKGGAPTEGGDLFGRFRMTLPVLDAKFEYEETRIRFSEKLPHIESFLRRLDSGQELQTSQWRVLCMEYADLIQAVAADQDVYLVSRRLRAGPGGVPWLRLQKATPREEAVEVLRKEDPDLYARTQESKEQASQISAKIKERILRDGKTPKVKSLVGRPMNVGVDAAGEEQVYDTDGEVLSTDDFVAKVRQKNQSVTSLRKVNPAPRMWPEQLHHLRRISESEITPELRATKRYISLTDDPHLDSKLTRIYPVVEINGEQVVCEGRFIGFLVPDLVNALGRQIEGSQWKFDETSGRVSKREVRDRKSGARVIRTTPEPYISLDNGKLFLRLNLWRPYKEARQRIDALARGLLVERSSTVEMVPGSRTTLYRFEPKDFAAIKQAVGSLSMSRAAARFLQDYFDELTKADQAANAGNLSRYSAENLGMQKPLRGHVKKALAWLGANGNKGICALDTGMGKTVTAIGSMQTLRVLPIDKNKNGKFLYVCEKALTGNLPKEISKFLEPTAATELRNLVEVVSYQTFARSRKADPTYGSGYVAIYFDEAHLRMKDKNQSAYKAAVGVQTRKILLTASPMVKSPKEVFTLASVANSQDLNTREGRVLERNFVARFSETVGGRIVGIRSDNPAAVKEFNTWVKRNLHFADKRHAEEEDSKLEELRQETDAVTMSPEVEMAYRGAMQELLPALQELVGLRFQDLPELAYEALARRVGKPLSRLSRLTDVPNRVIPGAPNPKLSQAARRVAQNISGRSLLFTDSPELAEDTFNRMREEFPGKGHVVGYSDRILYSSPLGEELKFTRRSYPLPDGGKTKAEDWQTHVLTSILGLGVTQTSYPVYTAVLTGSYAVGQNLQSFTQVVHLDRDDWSSETMKQRTARAWRSGNRQPVDEVTLDAVYSQPQGGEKTLDEIRAVVQKIDAELFNRVVHDSQSEKLGEEWLSIKKQRSALYTVGKRMAERALSPYAVQLGENEEGV